MQEILVKPFQKYTSDKKVYKIENSIEINFVDKRKLQSSFEISIEEQENEDKTKIWKINKIEDVLQISENPFLEILQKMEQNTYPLAIKVDDRGVFIEAVNHSKNIENWKIKTKKSLSPYDNTEKFTTQYLVTLENEELFYTNKNKEAFWNLLMFAPSYQNNGSKTQESINWFIKGVDFLQCEGVIRANKKDFGFASEFISEFILNDEFTRNLNEKFSKKIVQYRIDLKINMEYNSFKKQYFKKKLDIVIFGKEHYKNEKILYKEITTIQ